MGSCASAHRKSGSSGKFWASLVHSESGKHPDLMPSIPVKEKPQSVVVVDQPVNSVVYRSQELNSVSSFRNYGSKEEAFFDSQPWLESDCDDEFYSVNGDFTPSRDSTPLHSSIAGTPLSRPLSPQVNRALFDGRSPVHKDSATAPQVHSNADRSQNPGGSTTNLSPTEKKKKRLADLLRESISKNPLDEFSHQAEAELKPEASPPKSAVTTHISGPPEKEKHLKSSQCCFPRLPSPRGSKRALVATPPIAVDA